MKIFREPSKLQKWARSRSKTGAKIALVPTMGYLHEGHLSLIAEAKKRKADEIIVSVFVNPVQFGPNEDFAKYPRDEKADLAKCRAAGATAVFFPTSENMYLKDHSVYIDEELLSKGLCGARRPGHFRGVCTVVAKLFNLAHPDFGKRGEFRTVVKLNSRALGLKGGAYRNQCGAVGGACSDRAFTVHNKPDR